MHALVQMLVLARRNGRHQGRLDPPADHRRGLHGTAARRAQPGQPRGHDIAHGTGIDGQPDATISVT